MLGVGNHQDLSNDLECDPFLKTALQRFTSDLYYCFGAFLAPISVGIITGKHYTKKYPDRKSCQGPVLCRILHRIVAGLHNRERLTGSYMGSYQGERYW